MILSNFHNTAPSIIHLGITGHRFLADPETVKKDVQKVLEAIEQRFADKRGKPNFVLLSPLAEGADQLVAESVLARPGARLIVLLPFDEKTYLKGFTDNEAKRTFLELLKKAEKIIRLPAQPDQAHAFEAVGRYVVDHGDILLAIWDGKEARGRGGTAEVVAYARKRHKPLCWIHPEKPGRIKYENTYENIR